MQRPVLIRELKEKDSGNRKLGLYRCRCGKEWKTAMTHVKNGYSKSCGCIVTTHGKSKTCEYNIWRTMKARCNNPNHHEYHMYGGRGIAVCQEWQNSFETFYAYMGDRPSKRHSIDRIHNDGNYEPGNCQWALPKEQSRKTRRNRLLTYKGETKTLVEWSEIVNIKASTIQPRIDYYGFTIEEALETPKMKNQFG